MDVQPLSDALLRLVKHKSVSDKVSFHRREPNLSDRQKRQVRKIIKAQAEPNRKTTSLSSGTDITNTGHILDVSAIAQGDGDEQRVGDRVRPTSLRWNCFWTITTSDKTYCRMMVVRWHPDNAQDALDNVNLILEGGSYLAEPVSSDVARKKFDLLHDQTFLLAAATSNGSIPNAKILRKQIPLKQAITFNEGATTGKGKIYIIFLSNSASSNDCECAGEFRLRYKDV